MKKTGSIWKYVLLLLMPLLFINCKKGSADPDFDLHPDYQLTYTYNRKVYHHQYIIERDEGFFSRGDMYSIYARYYDDKVSFGGNYKAISINEKINIRIPLPKPGALVEEYYDLAKDTDKIHVSFEKPKYFLMPDPNAEYITDYGKSKGYIEFTNRGPEYLEGRFEMKLV